MPKFIITRQQAKKLARDLSAHGDEFYPNCEALEIFLNQKMREMKNKMTFSVVPGTPIASKLYEEEVINLSLIKGTKLGAKLYK